MEMYCMLWESGPGGELRPLCVATVLCDGEMATQELGKVQSMQVTWKRMTRGRVRVWVGGKRRDVVRGSKSVRSNGDEVVNAFVGQ